MKNFMRRNGRNLIHKKSVMFVMQEYKELPNYLTILKIQMFSNRKIKKYDQSLILKMKELPKSWNDKKTNHQTIFLLIDFSNVNLFMKK